MLIAFSLSAIDFANAGIYLGAGFNYVTLADDDWSADWGHQITFGYQWQTLKCRIKPYTEVFIEWNKGALNDKLVEISDIDMISDYNTIVHSYAIISYGIGHINYGCSFGVNNFIIGKRFYFDGGISLLYETKDNKYEESQKTFSAPPEEMIGKVDYEAEDYLSEGGNMGRQFNGKFIVGFGFEIIKSRFIARIRYNHWCRKVVMLSSYNASSRCRGITLDVLLSL